MTVTAEKRNSDLQKTPIALSVLIAEGLKVRTIITLRDVLERIPNRIQINDLIGNTKPSFGPDIGLQFNDDGVQTGNFPFAEETDEFAPISQIVVPVLIQGLNLTTGLRVTYCLSVARGTKQYSQYVSGTGGVPTTERV